MCMRIIYQKNWLGEQHGKLLVDLYVKCYDFNFSIESPGHQVTIAARTKRFNVGIRDQQLARQLVPI